MQTTIEYKGEGGFLQSFHLHLVYLYFFIMSRFLLNHSRLLMRPSPLMARRALFSTGATCLEKQQNTTHFGFRDVAEEEKESLGKAEHGQGSDEQAN